MMRWIFFLLVLLWTTPASANTVQLWMARYCVNEASFQVYDEALNYIPFEDTTIPDDCLAMYHSLLNNFEREELRLWMLRSYGDNIFNRQRESRRYIPYLRPYSDRSPPGWGRMDWDVYGPRFTEIYEYVGRVMSGTVSPKCEPHHWSAPYVRRHVQRNVDWILLDCGNTANDFWEVPDR